MSLLVGCLRGSLVPIVLIALIQGDGRRIESKPLTEAVRWSFHQHGDLAPVTGPWRSGGGAREIHLLEMYAGCRVRWDRHVECRDEPSMGERDAEPGRRRTFDRLSTEIAFSTNRGGEYEEDAVTLTSRLEGLCIAWRSGDDESPPEAVFTDDGLEDDWLLEGPVREFEPAGLLPDGPVKVGDRWRVDLDALPTVLLPGGDARIRDVDLEDLDDFLLLGGTLADLARDSAFLGAERSGAIRATYCSDVTSEGRRLARIDLELSCELSGELGERFRRMAAPRWGWAPVVFGERCRIDSRLRGTGRLYWDLERGRLDSLELRLKTDSAIVIPLTAELGGADLEAEIVIELEGYLDSDLVLEQI